MDVSAKSIRPTISDQVSRTVIWTPSEGHSSRGRKSTTCTYPDCISKDLDLEPNEQLMNISPNMPITRTITDDDDDYDVFGLIDPPFKEVNVQLIMSLSKTKTLPYSLLLNKFHII